MGDLVIEDDEHYSLARIAGKRCDKFSVAVEGDICVKDDDDEDFDNDDCVEIRNEKDSVKKSD